MKLDLVSIIYEPKHKRRLFYLLDSIFWAFVLLREYLSYYLFAKASSDFYPQVISAVGGFLITLFIRNLFIRFFSKIKSAIRLILILSIALFLSSLLWKGLSYYVHYLISKDDFWEEILINYILLVDLYSYSYYNLGTCFLWGTIYLGFFFLEKFLKQMVQTEEAQSLASKAQFLVLQNQLNPHFLFNSLNSVRALIFENHIKAAELITKLSDFLKFNLYQSELQFINFDQELVAIKNYLSIEKIRFEDDIEIEYEIDPKCNKALVIPNILLPIVDNAVKHGIKSSEIPLKIFVKAAIANENLDIMIQNSGRWIEPSTVDKNNGGRGLRIVKERLINIYNNRYSFNIQKEEDRVISHLIVPINFNEID